MHKYHEYLPHIVTCVLLIAGACYIRLVSLNPYASLEASHSRSRDRPPHLIDHLIRAGKAEHQRLSELHTHSVNDAAAAYRARRGRHPPPRFDQWVDFAHSKGSLINEEFFDQIYHDLEPFWGAEPYGMRLIAQTWIQSISVRDGVAHLRNSSIAYANRWMSEWMGAVQEFEHLLPDVDVAFNNIDEPRVIASWEDIDSFMQIAAETRNMRDPTADRPVLNEYTPYPFLDQPPPADVYKFADFSVPQWSKVRRACHPDSLGRKAELDMPWPGPVNFDALLAEDPDSSAYVTNWTSSRISCEHPELRYLHGGQIHPSSSEVTYKLMPIFSGCKISGINNDILVPAAEYFAQDGIFDGNISTTKRIPWEEKTAKAVWRGTASGGVADAETWRHFQRHRLVAAMNGTQIAIDEQVHYPQNSHALSEMTKVEIANRSIGNIPLPRASEYNLAALQTTPTTLGKWISTIMEDSGFTHFFCHGVAFGDPGDRCEYDDMYFHIVPHLPEHDMFTYKFLPDIDGQSYSGRYRAFLSSSSLPIKATVYSEWHDGRLVPWHHFVPLDNSYKDWFGIMEYFAGYDGATISDHDAQDSSWGDESAKRSTRASLQREAHDDEARLIAEQGMEWSSRVLRREDMVVYMYRLILEYARITDDHRLDMGWTGDL